MSFRQLQKWSCLIKQERKRGRKDLRERLLELYNLDPTDDVLAEIKDAQLGLNLEADKEELFWEQQA
ncbi:hypothetical protein EPI10_023822 [Gossypium australe]|uniref:Uncharacterized protein n=1 Tax=Gossypium australe TaxID=47621 RepID=A0A5B6VX91_9ROSI|nr:hypothetical protein EPI10_023822 [Gossypium australe]